MAQLAVAVAGAAIGSMFGMPQLGFMAGSLVGGLLFSPTTKQEGPRLTDLTVTSSAYGSTIPLLYGTARLPGNIIWSTGLIETKNTSGSGKGGQKVSQTTYTYSASFAVAFCQGEVEGLTRVWADGKLIYDRSSEGNVSTAKFVLRFYPGSETQMPDPKIVADIGADDTPAYRGIAYAVFEDMQLADFGNRIPQITAEIANSVDADDVVVERTVATAGAFSDEGRPYAIDWTTRRLFVGGTVAGGGGVSVYNIDTMDRIAQKTLADITGDSLSGSNPNYGSFAVDPGTSLFYLNYSGNDLYKIDINSMTATAAFRSATVTTQNSDRDIANISLWMAHNTAPSPLGDTKFLALGSLASGTYMILDSGTMTPVFGLSRYWDGASYVSIGEYEALANTTAQSETRFVAGASRAGSCDFYCWNYDKNTGSTEIAFYKMTATPDATFASGESSGVSMETLQPLDLADITSTTEIVSVGAEWDPADDTLLLSIRGLDSATPYQRIVKFDPNDGTIVWTKNVSSSFVYSNVEHTAGSRVVGNRWGVGLDDILVIDTSNGETVYSASGAVSGSNLWSIWDGYSESLVGEISGPGTGNQKFVRVYVNRQVPATVPLVSVIEDLCARAGMDVSEVDTTGLTGSLRGYVVARASTYRAAVEQICSTYFVEAVESDFKLKFRNKGQSSVALITQQWLGSEGQDEEGGFWVQTRIQEIELPRKVAVVHWDVDRDYQQGTQTDQRVSLPFPSMLAKDDSSVELPFVLNADEARQIAQKMLYTAWVERDRFSTRLPWRYIALDPGDPFTVTLDDGSTYSVRLVKSGFGADLSIDVECVSENGVTYTSTISGAPSTDGFPQQSIANSLPGRIFLLDIPLLRDGDDTAGNGLCFYFAGGQYSPGWPGGVIEQSDDGSTFSDFSNVYTPIEWGTAAQALPANPDGAFATDVTNSVVVYMQEGHTPLSTATRAEVLAGANAALLGSEIIQFETVTVNGDGSYTLTNLLRGRRGTEWACGDHTPGETFLILSTSTMQRTVLDLSYLNDARFYRMTTFGAFSDDSVVTGHTRTGAAEKPYAPVGIAREPDGLDLLVTWTRRTRMGGEWEDGTGTVPLNEDSEEYAAYVLSAPYDPDTFDASDTGTFVREFAGLTTPEFTYLEADMTTDGFDPATDTLYVVVFQISATVGLGFPGTANLEP